MTANPQAQATPATQASTRVLSGITPSGSLTLGNHLGALRRFARVGKDSDAYFFVANLHALTTDHDPQVVRDLTVETAALFVSAGVDPDYATVFVQSDVSAHAELSYLIESTAYVGELGRMIQFKAKGARPRTRASLFTYPCLMAADILLYDTERVPVGGDQDQHVEFARDIAIRFNRRYGDTFVVPELASAALASRVLDLDDPGRKMSKSDPPSATGVIRMLDDPATIARKITRAVTDSDGEVRYDRAAKPGVSNLLDLVAAVSDRDPQDLAATFTSYADLKRTCVEAVTAELEPIRRRHRELMAQPSLLTDILAEGALKARRVSAPVLARAQRAIGLAS